MMAENPVSAVEVLGVLTGQVPVRSMPIATKPGAMPDMDETDNPDDDHHGS
jgi:hypothetical protein